MKLHRLIALLTLLLQQDRISAPVLAEKFEVSVRTIYRDIQALESAGIPIVTHTGINGGIAIMEQYKIDKKLFTMQDIGTLLTSLHSITGSISNSQLTYTLEKIKGLIPPEHLQAMEINSRHLYVDMTPWSTNPHVPAALGIIHKALAQSQRICFAYHSRYSTTSQRTVEPCQLVLKENSWYLKGWCTQRQDFRTFKLSRMRDVQLLPECFTPRDFTSGMDDFKDWKHEKMITVELLADSTLHERAMDFCRDENIRQLEDGNLHISMPFVESDMGYGVLLSMGHHCRVLGPPHVREEFLRRLELTRSQYT